MREGGRGGRKRKEKKRRERGEREDDRHYTHLTMDFQADTRLISIQAWRTPETHRGGTTAFA